MEEKVLIMGKNNNEKKWLALLSIILVVSFAAFMITGFQTGYSGTTEKQIGFIIHIYSLCMMIISFILLIISLIFAKTSITVSDKRVFGCTYFGKRVDLPLDSISSVGMSAFKGIAIGTSSGKISFKGISNNIAIHNTISQLLMERQGKEKPVTTTTIRQEIPQSNADELKKFKELLDSGVITQEEFDAKKKQLLGL